MEPRFSCCSSKSTRLCTRSGKSLPGGEQPLSPFQARWLSSPPLGVALAPCQRNARLPARSGCPLLLIVNLLGMGKLWLARVEL